MANRTGPRSTEERSKQFGDTGDGTTGVAADQQGVSNRPGDGAQNTDPLDEDDEDVDADEGEDDDDGGLEDDEDDEVTDPRAEPGKPI